MSAHDDEVVKAETEFLVATNDIKKAAPGKQGFGHEAKYGDAYQRLVRAGVKPQIRRKYRG